MFTTIIAAITSIVTAHAGVAFSAGIASGLSASIAGNTLNWLLKMSWVQARLGWSLNLARGPGIVLALLLQTGPLKNFLSLIVIPIAWVGFLFLTGLDAFLDKLPESTQTFITPFLGALAKVGSQDRFAYVASKMAAPAPPTPAQELSTAIASPTCALPPGPITDLLNADAAAATSAELKST